MRVSGSNFVITVMDMMKKIGVKPIRVAMRPIHQSAFKWLGLDKYGRFETTTSIVFGSLSEVEQNPSYEVSFKIRHGNVDYLLLSIFLSLIDDEISAVMEKGIKEFFENEALISVGRLS